MDFVEPTEYEMAMQELRRGRDLVLMLQNLTTKPSSTDGRLVDARKLAEEVILALNTPITMFSRAGANVSAHDPAVTVNHPKYSPETPDGSGKMDTLGICEQTGGRRQRRYPSLKREWTPTPFDDDGFVWKKYGQKKIHGAKYHRTYYKCSQSTYQGCQATKQVQRANGVPSMFAVTRIGEHTCQKVIYASDFCTLDDSTSKDAFKITFAPSCRPSSSSTDSSVDSSWPKREETREDLPLRNTTSAGTVTRAHGEFQKLSEVYFGKSIEQSVLAPPDSLSPTSCLMSTADLTGDLRDIYGELLLLQEEDWSFF